MNELRYLLLHIPTYPAWNSKIEVEKYLVRKIIKGHLWAPFDGSLLN